MIILVGFSFEVVYGSIYLDKETYTWTDKVYIKIITHGYDADRDTIRIYTSDHELDSYRLSKAGNNLYTGEVTLTGFLHDANGDGKPDTNPRTTGSGSNNGFLETKRDEGLTVSLEFGDGTVESKSAKISWNEGEISYDKFAYHVDDSAKLQVIDPDMNLNPDILDKVQIHVSSDSDKAGILVNAIETQEESGIFEASIIFEQDRTSSGNRLYIINNDAIYAKYEDYTLPSPHGINDNVDVIAESTITTDITTQSESEKSTPNSFGKITGILNLLTEEESVLIEQGYVVEPYSIMPFGDKHFFYKTEKQAYPAETNFSRCVMSATILTDYFPTSMIMKFPSDLIWPGMYENSTFFVIKNIFPLQTDENGNKIYPEEGFEKIQPIRDSHFATLEFDLKDKINHVIVNFTTNNKIPWTTSLDECPPIIPKMEFDYYDTVLPYSTQRLIAEGWGLPPDTFICKNNLIGATKTTNDKPVCVTSETKAKLVQRGWAKAFN